MSKHILHNIQFISPKVATGLVADVYQQIQGDMMTVPEPFSVLSPAADVLAGSWSLFREALESGSVSRGHKETVAVSVAQINECPWCVHSHSITLHATGLGDVVSTVNGGEAAAIEDLFARGLFQWAKATRTPGDPILLAPPFDEAQRPEIVGTAFMFHYLTRVVNVTLADNPLPAAGWLGGALKKGLGLVFRGKANGQYPAGQSLAFLPDAPLPIDMGWAASNTAVAGALARFNAAVEAGAERTLSAEVRDVVHQAVSEWRGEEMGLSRAWVDEKVAALGDRDRPVAKLTLLSALASHQVDESVISAFRAVKPDDQALIEAVAWGSFWAARQITSWLV